MGEGVVSGEREMAIEIERYPSLPTPDLFIIANIAIKVYSFDFV